MLKNMQVPEVVATSASAELIATNQLSSGKFRLSNSSFFHNTSKNHGEELGQNGSYIPYIPPE